VTDNRLKIAVFIDFDNIEIGVKTTMNQNFDVGVVLEAIKERGEVVTKVAYSDWKRAGDYSRQLSHHAIRMVQRNLTPGGDKNGADINLALDALEMAFTHDHINAFVIVGGDSDFITLVEKLKQYDKKVFVVGGRQFTSMVMQKNCHEFIAYENLSGARRPAAGGRAPPGGGVVAAADLEKALPLVKRALKVLSDREVTPQLGLLKSTLLQLDSTFSERDYGASTFRDFIEKVAERGIVTLKQAGRSVLVELADSALAETTHEAAHVAEPVPTEPGGEHGETREVPRDGHSAEGDARRAVSTGDATEAVKLALRLFEQSRQTPRWPMYIRQIRQYLRNADETFDERKLGFAGIVEFLRACQREGLLRLERDRQGVMRVFPGPSFPKTGVATPQEAQPVAQEPLGAEPVPEAGFDLSEPIDAAAEQGRFHRVTDDVVDEPSESVIEAVAVETPSAAPSGHDEEDLSVGPGNVAGVETHDPMAAHAARSSKRPRRTTTRAAKSTPATRTRRAPRARKKD
jgi:uncharacterized LabA/DUF88 family protein